MGAESKENVRTWEQKVTLYRVALFKETSLYKATIVTSAYGVLWP
jgi:hypothetical protein